ncbi:hypothetical protein ACJD0Z_03695 [Flavobacteriaceae bacterium M23B6Z8]
MIKSLKTISLIYILLISGCATTQEEYDISIQNVNVIDYVSGEIRYHKDVIINGEMIVKISDHSLDTSINAKKIIDGTHKYLIPGLWDNHVHLRGGDTLIDANKEFLNLFIANGITGIRDAGGDLYKEVLQWRKDIASGVLLGPVIFTSGPKIDGIKPTWAGSIEVADTSKVKDALDSLQSLQIDFVKIYDSSISREVYLEILKQAKARDMITSGHMPFSYYWKKTLEMASDP